MTVIPVKSFDTSQHCNVSWNFNPAQIEFAINLKERKWIDKLGEKLVFEVDLMYIINDEL